MTPDIDALYEQALAALERWELDEAEEALRSLIQADPEHARAYNKLGVVLARARTSGRPRTALPGPAPRL